MSRPDPILDERFDEIVAQLRGTKPRVSADLRMRVREIAGAAPPARRTLAERIGLGRALVPALAASLLVVALAGVALVSRGGGAQEGAGESAGRAAPSAVEGAPASDAATEEQSEAIAPAGDAELEATAVPAPSETRLQNYSADLTVRVDDLQALSEATAQAMATARRLGGFVVTARYESPQGPEGDSYLVVRVPVARVQAAIAAYAELGALVGQQIAIDDAQPRFDALVRRIERTQERIGALGRQLAAPGLTDDERLVLRTRLEAAQAELRVLRDQRQSTVRQARLARISLTLTTRGADELKPPGDSEQTLRDALGALETVSVWLLAALIVAAPFAALAAAGMLMRRRLRRRSVERLLERPGS